MRLSGLERLSLALALVTSPIDVAFDQPGQSWCELRWISFGDQGFDDSECIIRVETLNLNKQIFAHTCPVGNIIRH
jgi:hypothetical protein